jgi:DMSO/TMAO reductase YedYZ molybdopterin-dependent catalytic subunit
LALCTGQQIIFAHARPPQLEHSVNAPLNREPPVKELISSFITTKGAYDRNHGPTPHLDSDQHRVMVDGAVVTPLELSISILQALPQHSVTCALQCAGNRRHTMRTLLKEVVSYALFMIDCYLLSCVRTALTGEMVR